MRFSGYNILSRRLNSGEYVILNGLKGTLDLIDDEAYQLFAAYSDSIELPREVLDQMAEVRDHFLERGYLTPCSKEEEVAEAEKTAFDLYAEKKDEMGFVLIPSLGCNYRCTYCFEQGAGYPSQKMSRAQVDAIFEIIKDKLSEGTELSLYGGEPLAKENRDIIEYILEKGAAFGCHFFAVTNAHDLEYYMDLLGSDKISSLQITIDGPKEIHDRRRISLDRESSYDRILANIEKALHDTDVSVKLRMNVDRQNAPFIPSCLQDMDQRGFLDNPRFYIIASPVVGVGELTLEHDGILNLEKCVGERFPVLRERFFAKTIAANHAVLPALYFGQQVHRIATACAASGNAMVFSPDGMIHSCWACVGKADQAIGGYKEDGSVEWNQETLNSWKRTMLAYRKDCLDCKYAFFCAGGCSRPALPKEISAHEYDCDYYKNMFDDYLARMTEEYLVTLND